MTPFPSLSEMIGHPEPLATLHRALSTGKSPHALLFHGPSGVGKFTMAMAYASALLCRGEGRGGENNTSGCGRCSSCKKVQAFCHADLFMVRKGEEKTRISVEQVRELTRFLGLTPMESSWKVAIVDDASQMNLAAANALLKTLEEPPSNSILVLVSNRMGMLLPTLRSRCAKVRFQSLSQDDFSRILKEKMNGSEAEIALAKEISDGDLGRAIQYSQGGVLADWEKLRRALHDMTAEATLSGLSDLADYWSKAERFYMVKPLVQTWFMEKIRGLVFSGESLQVQEWLQLAKQAEDYFSRAETFNINKRLLLEGIFIRVARFSGAPF